MTVTQVKVLKNALHKAQLIELNYIDTLPKYDISSSEKINNSIKEISESFQPKKKRISNKLVFILVAAVITTFLIISISAGEKIKEFIVDIYENYISINLNDDYNNQDNVDSNIIFLPSYIPNDYQMKETNILPGNTITTWENDSHRITLSQNELSHSDFRIDNETEYYTFVINGKTIYYMHKHNTYFAIWSEGKYIFDISCHDSVSLDEIKNIISSLEETE